MPSFQNTVWLWSCMWYSIFDPCADAFLILNWTSAERPYLCTTVLFCLYESTYLFLEITCFITNITVRLNFLFPTLFSKFVCFRIIDNCTIRRSTWRLNNSSKDSRIIFVGYSKCLQWCEFQFYNIFFIGSQSCHNMYYHDKDRSNVIPWKHPKWV